MAPKTKEVKKTKVVTTAEYEGALPANPPTGEKTRKEKSFEECMQEASDGMFVSIDRVVSQKDHKGKLVTAGYLDKIAATEDGVEYIKGIYGGGTYCLRLRDEGGNYVKAKTIKIAGFPKMNGDEQGEEDEEDEVSRMQKRVKVARSRKDLKEVEKELNTYEDEGDESQIYAQIQALQSQHSQEMEKLKKDFERQRETDKLREEMKDSALQTKELISAMQEETRELIKSLAGDKSKMTPESWAKIIGSAVPVISGLVGLLPKRDPDADWRKMKDLITTLKPKEGEASNLMKENMQILIANMQSGQEIAMKQMMSGTTMMIEFAKKGMETAIDMGSAGGTPPNIKMEIVKRVSDIAKDFMNNILDFNKQKLTIEGKKLDLMKPSSRRITAKPVDGRSMEMEEDGEEIVYEEPESDTQKASPEKVQMALLMNSVRDGIERGEDPQFVARNTRNIVSTDLALKLTQMASGEQVVSYVVDELEFDAAYKQAYLGNALVKNWIDSWLIYLKGGTPSQEQVRHFHKKEKPVVGGYETNNAEPPEGEDEEAEIEGESDVDLSEGDEKKESES